MLASRTRDYRPLKQFTVPASAEHHWRGIRARVVGFDELRAAQVDSKHNPAHVLANEPGQYAHVNQEPARCLLPEVSESDPQIPPPSRADRRVGD